MMNDEIFLKRDNSINTIPNINNNPAHQNINNIPKQSAISAYNMQPKNTYQCPTETFELPSKGFFYPSTNPASKGEIELKMMTACEEDILTSQKLIKNGTVLYKLLDKLIVTPGIVLDDLLFSDFNTLIYYVRRVAYGDNYDFTIKCPSCDMNQKESINLSVFNIKEINYDALERGVNSFTYVLPKANRTIMFKLLTVADNKKIESEIKALSKVTRSGIDPLITTRLKYSIISIDGKSDLNSINRFVNNELLSIDSLALREHISSLTPTLDTSYDFICQNCGYESDMEMPIEAGFFWPKTRN